VAKIEKTDR